MPVMSACGLEPVGLTLSCTFNRVDHHFAVLVDSKVQRPARMQAHEASRIRLGMVTRPLMVSVVDMRPPVLYF